MRDNHLMHTTMRGVASLGALLCLGLLSACNLRGFPGARDELVPTVPEVEAARKNLPVNILHTLGENDEPEAQFTSAVDVRPQDLKPVSSDYRIGANDLLQISILDVLIPGSETARTVRVTESGMITIAGMRETIRAAGRTEAQLQREIAEKLSEAKVLMNPQVTVLVVEARQRTFSVTGAVQRGGQYVIYESDFRLLDALVQAGDVSSPPDYVYVIRRTASEKPATQPAQTPRTTVPEQPDPLAPRSEASKAEVAPVTPVLAAETTTAPVDDGGKYIIVDGKPRLVGDTTPPADASKAPADASKAPADASKAPADPARAAANATTSRFEFSPPAMDEDRRIIRVPYEPLRNGELRYNIVIRPGDMVLVPMPAQGEFYVGGHVNRPGAYSLTARKITLIQAIISAGMLDQLAVPDRAFIIRRVRRSGTDQHLFYAVDISEIFCGRQPDIFLKPYDNVLVGTDAFAPFLAAVRNAFRISYGGGFIYDRNYAYDTNGNIR